MIKVADLVLIIFITSSVLGFFLRFIKDGVWKQLTFKPLIQRFPLFALMLVPFVALFLIGNQFGVAAAAGLPFFGGAILLSYLLSAINLPSYLRGILLLGASVALSLLGPEENYLVTLGSALVGLFAHKLTENLSFSEQSYFDDILPPFIWLTGVMWINSVQTGGTITTQASALLGIMSVSLGLRFFQGPILKPEPADDKWFLKRLLLSATGGAAVLIVVVKILAAMNLQMLGWLCGGGYLLTYLFKNVDDVQNVYAFSSHKAVKMLMLVGILTLLASKFFGTFGLLALAPVAMVAPISSAALIPGLFWASRALLQVFLQNYNNNVTGINLNHQYAGAAMYAGFLLAIVLTCFFKEIKDRRLLLTIMTGVGVVAPVMANFILHAEPTCSLLVSTTVSSMLLSVMSPALLKNDAKGVENLMLVPGLMIGSALISGGLLQTGLETTMEIKTTVLSYGIVFVLLMSTVYWWLFQRGIKKPPAATEAGA